MVWKITAFITIKQTHSLTKCPEEMNYVLMQCFLKNMHTKTWVTAGCQAETVGDGCLSQPFGFRLSDWAHYCHQAETLIWAMSRLISASLKVSLWEKLGARSLREDWIKMSSGADWARLHPLSRPQCLGANDEFQWRVGGPKHSADWLSQCLRKMSTLVCCPSFTDKVLCIMQIFLHIRELFYLADCQHFHTHWNFSRGTHPFCSEVDFLLPKDF